MREGLWKGRKKGGIRQEEVGRASAVPMHSPGLPYPKLSHLHAFPGLLPSAWRTLPSHSSKTSLSVYSSIPSGCEGSPKP